MKTKLIAYFEQQESYLGRISDLNEKLNILHNCFGALSFAMSLVDDWDAETEYVNLWDEWCPRLEAQIYG